jgi:hypothetical protein
MDEIKNIRESRKRLDETIIGLGYSAMESFPVEQVTGMAAKYFWQRRDGKIKDFMIVPTEERGFGTTEIKVTYYTAFVKKA